MNPSESILINLNLSRSFYTHGEYIAYFYKTLCKYDEWVEFLGLVSALGKHFYHYQSVIKSTWPITKLNCVRKTISEVSL